MTALDFTPSQLGLHWPRLRQRLTDGRDAVLTAAATVAVLAPILWTGFLVLLTNSGRLLVWLADLLRAIGEHLQQAQPQVPVTQDEAVAYAINHLELVDDRTDPDQFQDFPDSGYVIAAPACPLPQNHAELIPPAPFRSSSRKRSSGAGRRTSPGSKP